MKRKRRIRRWLMTGLEAFLLAILLLILARHMPGFAAVYVRRVYPLLAGSLGRFWSLVPFSAVELLLYLFVIVWVVLLVKGLAGLLRRKKEAGLKLAERLAALFQTAAVLFLVYVLGCGINYSAPAFSDLYGYSKAAYTKEELALVCEMLTERLIDLADEVPRDETGFMVLEADTGQKVLSAIQALGEECPALAMVKAAPKRVLISPILSCQQLTGVYSPFTIEANYNRDMVSYNVPFTMGHELSHLAGFMREDEANFISWLALERAEDVTLRCSAAMMAWIYCCNELHDLDYEKWEALNAELPKAVSMEFEANSAFWKRYESRVSEKAQKVNDSYLKAHGQTEGLMTYDRVTALIVQEMLRRQQGFPD